MWVTGAHPTPEYPLPSQVVWGRVKLPYTALATLEHWNHRGAHPGAVAPGMFWKGKVTHP